MRVDGALSCHAWNADGSCVALSPCDGSLRIYRVAAGGQPWELQHSLEQLHDRRISGVDWCHATDRIATCSHDANAFVLSRQEGGWKQDLVVTRLKRAALCLAWAPGGGRLAIGGAGKDVSVCYADGGKGWWAAALIRKHGSAVTGVAWDPHGRLLATCCADGSCRVFHAVPNGGRAGGEFGQLLWEVPLGCGWGTAVAWSPCGAGIAVSSHGSLLSLLSLGRAGEGPPRAQQLRLEGLPLRSLAFLGSQLLAGGGFDGRPALFAPDSAGAWAQQPWQPDAEPGRRPASGRKALGESQLNTDFAAKLALFKASPSGKGAPSEAASAAAAGAARAHEKAIAEVRRRGEGGFSSAGLDGRVLLWTA